MGPWVRGTWALLAATDLGTKVSRSLSSQGPCRHDTLEPGKPGDWVPRDQGEWLRLGKTRGRASGTQVRCPEVVPRMWRANEAGQGGVAEKRGAKDQKARAPRARIRVTSGSRLLASPDRVPPDSGEPLNGPAGVPVMSRRGEQGGGPPGRGQSRPHRASDPGATSWTGLDGCAGRTDCEGHVWQGLEKIVTNHGLLVGTVGILDSSHCSLHALRNPRILILLPDAVRSPQARRFRGRFRVGCRRPPWSIPEAHGEEGTRVEHACHARESQLRQYGVLCAAGL